MRISEVLALDQEDVNCKQGVLEIRRSKFGKSRLVPLHLSSCRALCKYVHHRDHIYPRPKAPSFFIDERGMRLGYWGVLRTFIRLSHEIGLRGSSDSYGPRLQDFRHRLLIFLNCYKLSSLTVS